MELTQLFIKYKMEIQGYVYFVFTTNNKKE